MSEITSQQDQILEAAQSIANEIIEHRRHLHTYPELSFEEHKTADYIRHHLTSMGIEWTACATTGTVALIGDSSNPCIALRADIDALPIKEATGLSFSSSNDGIMHACGHDAHTAMLLGAARLLKQREHSLKVCVKLIFQPGEEKAPGGAGIMINEGVLDNPRPVAIFGQHVYPFLEAGSLAFADDVMMGAPDELFWEFTGVGGHAAQPHLTADPIVAMAHVITALQTVVSRTLNPIDSGVLSITAVEGGFANNVIPEKVMMKGTLRSMNAQWREEALARIQLQSETIARSFGVECKVKVVEGYPPLVNTPSVVRFVRLLAETHLGKEKAHDFEPKMWGEDFAFFAREIPACFWMLGTMPSDRKPYGLHHQEFTLNEEALYVGTAMLASVALNFDAAKALG